MTIIAELLGDAKFILNFREKIRMPSRLISIPERGTCNEYRQPVI